MRLLLVLVFLGACAQLPDHRPLIVDNVPYGVDRDAVRGWHAAHGWCMRRAWPTTDEFIQCNPRPYLNKTTPAMFSMIRYDERGWSTSYAVFVPVPCTMEGRCEEPLGHTWVNPDYEFIDPETGLFLDLADRGRRIERADTGLPDMQSRMYDALRTEIESRRHVVRTWFDAQGYGETWETPNTKLGLFVASNGAWIIETHEIKASVRATKPADAHPPGTFVSL